MSPLHASWPPGAGRMAERLRAPRGDAGALGPPSDWPARLRAAVELVLAHPDPMAVFWGREARTVPNDAFAALAGPGVDLLGVSAIDAPWGADAATLARVRDGETVVQDDEARRVFTPLRDDAGGVAGVLATRTAGDARRDARYRALVEGWAQAVWQADPQGRLLGDTSSWERSTGVPVGDAAWFAAVHPDDRGRAREQWQRSVALARPHEGEYRLWDARSRTWRWTAMRGAPQLGEDGRVQHWIGMTVDVAERHEVEARLRESEARMARAMEIETVGVASFDLDGRLLGANAAFARMSGYAREDILAGHLHWHDLTPPEWRPQAREAAEQLRVQGTSAPYEVQLLRADGTRWWGLCTASRLDEHLAVAFVLDISERRRADAVAHENAERLRLVVQSARDYAIFTTDPQHKVVDWYPGAQAVFGYRADEIRGADASILFVEEDRAAGVPREELDLARRQGSAPDVRWHLRQDGSRVFIDGRTIVLRGLDGDVRGYLKIGQDVTERRRSDTALRESEERFSQFGEHSSDVLWIIDAHTRALEYLSPAFERVWGASREAIMTGRARWSDYLHAEDRAYAMQSLPRVLAGEPLSTEYRIVRPDGEIRWVFDTGFPIRDREGRVVRAAGIAQDITARRNAEDALSQSESRLRTLMEGIPQLVWRSQADGLWTWSSPQWQAFTGQTLEESCGIGWLDAVHPDDRAAALQEWHVAPVRGGLDVEYRIRRASDGAYLWHHTRSRPVYAADGAIVEWLGTSTDVQQLKELQERQSVLVAELQHRTRNLMGVVRAMADRTMRGARSYEDFIATYDSRLGALARVQGLLSRLDEGERITFDELLRAELSAMGMLDGDGHGDRIALDGPAGVRLRSSSVQILALALHELATNALKYGAFAQPEGRLRVEWRAERGDHGPVLTVEWRESGVQMPAPGAPPRGSGYGRELIERALPYQLQARTAYRQTSDGVCCRIELPVSARHGDDGEPGA